VWQTHHASEILEINGAWAALTVLSNYPLNESASMEEAMICINGGGRSRH